MTSTAQLGQWAEMLRAFSNRNAGRRTILEVDTPDYGAQEEEVDYPLWGVTFDPHDDRVQIMLGDQGSVDRHLTHSIGMPTAIDVLSERGRDRALRIVHDGGQTLLKLLDR